MVTGAGVSRALCIGITMTALTGPPLAAYDRAASGTHDTDPILLVGPYLVLGLAMFVLFAPAMTVAVGHSPTARHVWLATAWLLGCLAAAYVGRSVLNNVAGLLLFPAAGVVAMIGALRITGSLLRAGWRRRLP